MKNEKLFFNLISSFYGLADRYFAQALKQASIILSQEISLQNQTVLDVGTGTGSWALQLFENGAQVHGIDFSKALLKKAIKRHGDQIKFSLADATRLPFEDKSFDFVSASLVLHGPSQEKRQIFIREMSRVARQGLIIHDYFGPAHPLVHFAENIERSDYYNFRKYFAGELKEKFPKVKVLRTAPGLALYLASKE